MVAIKKFKESDNNPIIKKIALREVKALKNLDHKNVVKFKEAFKRDNKLNIVFEFVEKTVLEDIETNPSGVPVPLIRSYLFQLLKALRYLHRNGIIHRDVKPENLLVDGQGVLKLCDFGFARRMNEAGDLTRPDDRLRGHSLVPVARADSHLRVQPAGRHLGGWVHYGRTDRWPADVPRRRHLGPDLSDYEGGRHLR